MITSQQPEALRLAEILEQYALNPLREVASELRRQHARIEELEAQLSAIGAGGDSWWGLVFLLFTNSSKSAKP